MKSFLLFLLVVIWLCITAALFFSILGIALIYAMDLEDDWFQFGNELKDTFLNI